MENPAIAGDLDIGHCPGDRLDVDLLRETATRLSLATPLHDVLNDVMKLVTTVVSCDSCMIYVLEKDELVLRVSKNPHPEVVDRLKIRVGHGITGWVAEHLEPVVLAENACLDQRFQLFNELPEDRFEAFLSVPAVSGGRLVGVINVQNRARHQYTEREIRVLATIGFLVGAKIERARLECENLALLDRLVTRSCIDGAKVILQRDLKVTEAEAYRILQRQSQDRCKPMREIAEAVMLTHDMRQRFSN